MMNPEELDRRCAELKARMVAARNLDGTSVEPLVALAPKRRPPTQVESTPVGEICDPHPLIVHTRKGVSKEKAGDDRLLRLANAHRLDIKVSRQALPRALWIFDSLLKAAELHGMSAATVQRDSAWCTVIVACGESIRICLREHMKPIERPRPANRSYWYGRQFDYFPTGRLTFEIDEYTATRRNWNDGARQRLENCIESITHGLLSTGERLREQRIRREAEEQIRRAESQYIADRERAAGEERDRIEALNRDVGAWYQSERIRTYLAALRNCMEKWSGPIQPKTDLGRWLVWAESYADRLDPLQPQHR